MQNYVENMWCYFSVLDQKNPIWANLIKKIKIVSLSWNLVPRLIWISRIQWWCSIFLFLTINIFLGQIWSKTRRKTIVNTVFLAPYSPVFTESSYDEYGKIIQKIYRNCIQPYSIWIRENTGFFCTVFSRIRTEYDWLQFLFIFWIIFPYSF